MTPSIFQENEAKYFCSGFSSSSPNPQLSISEFQTQQIGLNRILITEGTALFDQLRSCLLREAERCLFLGASIYRRSLDLMVSSSSFWLYVTLYYGTWYCANALLAMFGCSILYKHVIDVNKGNTGNQQLLMRQIGGGTGKIQSQGTGSHQQFWSFFYSAVGPLIRIVDPRLSPCLEPINNNTFWLINNRNKINYISSNSYEIIEKFLNDFDSRNFPGSLSGRLSTQFEIFELMLELSFEYSRRFNLKTDALDFLMNGNGLYDKVKKYIYMEKAPSLISRTIKSKLI